MFLFLILSLSLAPVAQGHMSMAFPKPRSTIPMRICASTTTQVRPIDVWEWNDPMVPVWPCTCHGALPDATIRADNVFDAGATIDVVLTGNGNRANWKFHGGGHCSFWWSTDGVTFKKFVDVKDCTKTAQQTGLPIQIKIPTAMDEACGTRCILAWTWIPVRSPQCEIYMTCADVQIRGATGGGTPVQELNFADIATGATRCKRVGASRWSPLFTPIKVAQNSGARITLIPVTARPTVTAQDRSSKCPKPDAPTSWGPIQNDGSCGPGVGICEPEMCCSSHGRCTSDCTNSQADFRLVWCCAIVNGVYDENLAQTCAGAITTRRSRLENPTCTKSGRSCRNVNPVATGNWCCDRCLSTNYQCDYSCSTIGNPGDWCVCDELLCSGAQPAIEASSSNAGAQGAEIWTVVGGVCLICGLCVGAIALTCGSKRWGYEKIKNKETTPLV